MNEYKYFELLKDGDSVDITKDITVKCIGRNIDQFGKTVYCFLLSDKYFKTEREFNVEPCYEYDFVKDERYEVISDERFTSKLKIAIHALFKKNAINLSSKL